MLESLRIKKDKNVDIQEIINLYALVGWQKKDDYKIQKAIEKSILLVTIWKDKDLIATGRAAGDGIFNATLWDVAVHPRYQKKGIGKFLVETMIKELDEQGIPLVTLYTSDNKKLFYKKIGFEADTDKVLGMYKYIK